jgi:hypothetical protein
VGVPYLDPSDPGIYRNQRGRAGASELMAQDVGTGGRYVITTGEADMVNNATAALPANWRRAFDVFSPGFALIVLVFLLLLIHARFEVSARGSLAK